MITDEQLNERADELTTLFDMAGYGTFTTNPLRIYWNLTREALERDKEGLKLLIEARSFVRRDGDNDRGLSHRIDAYTTTLRKRLGLTT